jgi:hypothetical protein
MAAKGRLAGRPEHAQLLRVTFEHPDPAAG